MNDKIIDLIIKIMHDENFLKLNEDTIQLIGLIYVEIMKEEENEKLVKKHTR